jgi:hypothetical protein
MDDSRRAAEALSARLETVVSQWRARLRQQISGDDVLRPEVVIAEAEADLRHQLAGVEQEAALLDGELAREAAAMAHWEASAIAAVRAGDDDAARDALRHQAHHSEAFATLQAEVTLLNAMANSCRELLAMIVRRKEGS